MRTKKPLLLNFLINFVINFGVILSYDKYVLLNYLIRNQNTRSRTENAPSNDKVIVSFYNVIRLSRSIHMTYLSSLAIIYVRTSNNLFSNFLVIHAKNKYNYRDIAHHIYYFLIYFLILAPNPSTTQQ